MLAEVPAMVGAILARVVVTVGVGSRVIVLVSVLAAMLSMVLSAVFAAWAEVGVLLPVVVRSEVGAHLWSSAPSSFAEVRLFVLSLAVAVLLACPSVVRAEVFPSVAVPAVVGALVSSLVVTLFERMLPFALASVVGALTGVSAAVGTGLS
ncbi:MAG: hypothetical protein KVP17_003383 [Porospora cf. gigantea B]|uniref:uncharacterized protein n=1 Tax=Porospora cf. gigantea B TaxID=2853592 RepID=UPI003571D7B9|nr:MAG: hypothetical protein KVP17_003383 [Porospora cf. gigantea B]